MLKKIAQIATAGAAFCIIGAGVAHAQSEEALAAPEEPPPTLPTTGDGAVIVKLLSDVCQPMLEGRGQFEQLVTAAGLRKERNSDDYIIPLSQRPFQISMRPPTPQNRTVCELNVRYAPGWQGPIIEALNVWRFLHTPQLRLQRNEQYDDRNAAARRTINTWDNWENQGYDNTMVGLVMTQLRNPDGTPLNRQYDEARIQYQKRPPLAEMVAAAQAYREAVRQQELQQQQQQQQQEAAPPAPSAGVPATAAPAS